MNSFTEQPIALYIGAHIDDLLLGAWSELSEESLPVVMLNTSNNIPDPDFYPKAYEEVPLEDYKEKLSQEAELLRKQLGLADFISLDYQDGQLAAYHEQIENDLREIKDRFNVRKVVAPALEFGHSDHDVTALLAQDVFLKDGIDFVEYGLYYKNKSGKYVHNSLPGVPQSKLSVNMIKARNKLLDSLSTKQADISWIKNTMYNSTYARKIPNIRRHRRGVCFNAKSDVKPEFSIIISNYNGAKSLPTLISSLERQTTKIPFEVIVVDDLSDDESDEFLVREKRVNVFGLTKNSGSEAAPQNIGTYLARSKYVGFIDNDDYLHRTDAIDSIVAEFRSDPKVFFIYTNMIFQIEHPDKIGPEFKWTLPSAESAVAYEPSTDDKNIIIGRKPETIYSRRLAKPQTIFDVLVRAYPGGFRVFKKQVLGDIGGWPVEIGKNDDYGLILKAFALATKQPERFHIKALNLNAYTYRIHGANATSTQAEPKSAIKAFALKQIKDLGLTWQQIVEASSNQKKSGDHTILERLDIKENDL